MSSSKTKDAWPAANRRIHGSLVFPGRTRSLSTALADAIPRDATVLDIGCGDGTIDELIMAARPDTHIHGIEVSVRPTCRIECEAFDGSTIPRADASVDACMLVDVLHHTRDPEGLVREASRVARRHVLIKDHLCRTRLDWATLRLMDWVGNRSYGVSVDCNYLSPASWHELFATCGLSVAEWRDRVRVYGCLLNPLFGRGLHVIALLEKA